MMKSCGSTTAIAPIGLSQCSRFLSPEEPPVPEEPCTTLPPCAWRGPVIPWARTVVETSSTALKQAVVRSRRIALAAIESSEQLLTNAKSVGREHSDYAGKR